MPIGVWVNEWVGVIKHGYPQNPPDPYLGWNIHRHIGGLENDDNRLTERQKIHRHIGGLEIAKCF